MSTMGTEALTETGPSKHTRHGRKGRKGGKQHYTITSLFQRHTTSASHIDRMIWPFHVPHTTTNEVATVHSFIQSINTPQAVPHPLFIICATSSLSALQTPSHPPPRPLRQRLVLHTNIHISIAHFLSFFLLFFLSLQKTYRRGGNRKRILTPQLLHPQLAQLPLQLEQLLQEQGPIFFGVGGSGKGNVGSCW